MDRRQSAISMQSSSAANAGAAVQEWLYPGGWQPEQAVVVGSFLMELLEDAPVAEQPPEDLDRLSRRVIRSLEAEIGSGGGPPPSAMADGGGTVDHVPGNVHNGGPLEDYLLPELDSIPGPCVAEAPLEFWTEVPPAVGHDMGGWYIDGDGDGDGVMVGYEFRDQCYYGYSESPHVEQVYSPLWE